MMLSPALIVLSKGRGEPPTGSNLIVISAARETHLAYCDNYNITAAKI